MKVKKIYLIFFMVILLGNITLSETKKDKKDITPPIVKLDISNFDTNNLEDMNALWQRIVKLDSRIAYEPYKEKLSELNDEYNSDWELYMQYLKENPEELFNVGDYYFKNERYEKALSIFSQDNTLAKNIYGSAVCSRFLHYDKRSLKYYNELIKKYPSFYEAYLGRGIIYKDTKNYMSAIRDFRKYEKYNQSESVYLGLADSYMGMNDIKNAKKILLQAKKLYPQSKLIRDLLSKAYRG